MKLTIRSHAPAWNAEYEVHTDDREVFRVKTSRNGNFHHIHVFDMALERVGHVFQNNTGITGECRGWELLTVDRRLDLSYQMYPVIQSSRFRWCGVSRGYIKERNYDLDTNRCLIRIYPSDNGIEVEYPDHLAQPLEVLVLILAIEAIAQYT